MRDTYLILGVCVIAILIGGSLYFWGPKYFQELPARTTPSTQASTQTDTANAAQVASPVPASNGPVSFTVLDQGQHAAEVPDRKNYAVYDATEFAKIWTMAHGEDGTPAPVVDFNKNYVIAVFMGQEPTGGYAIQVTKITDTNGGRAVSVTLTKPGSGCIENQLITRPYQIVIAPMSMNTLTHEDKTNTTPCPN